MRIYFIRHGEAEDKQRGANDKDRALTSFGAATILNTSKDLKGQIGSIDLIISSPLLRAIQTADILGNLFNCRDKTVCSESLLIEAPPSVLLDEIKKHKDKKNIFLVGHQPNLGVFVSFLTGTKEEDMSIKKGSCGLVVLDKFKAGAGSLKWIKEPPKLK